jgi:SAM-dependent methyltransferase
VRFAEAVRSAWGSGIRLFVEIGPAPVLAGMARRSVTETGGTWMAPLRKGHDDLRGMLDAVATLYARGASIDWDGVWRGRSARRVSLPTYPFERERHWSAPRHVAASAGLDPATRWQHAVDAGQRQALEGPLDLAIGTMAEKWARLDAIAMAFIVDALRGLGAFGSAGERHTPLSLRIAAGVRETYEPLLRRWLDALAAAGHLRADGDACVADVPLPATHPRALVEAARPVFADFPPILDYAERCGRMLVDVLTGRESALETLFPGGSSALADAIYSQWPVSRYFNGIVRASVAALAATATPERPLRILEIGAGTGSTTAGLLPALPGDRVRYAFTDVGALFVSRARERFTACPFVRYHQLDIERHPSEQGFQPHTWDVIVAANVLHATQDLHRTIDHAAWLLASGGTLVMYEATSHPLWMDVTTGLISGWQRFRDDLRTGSPLVASGVWERAVRAHGFDAFVALPGVGSAAEILAQHVLLARGPRFADAADASPDDTLSAGTGAPSSAMGVAADAAVDVRAHLASLPQGDRHDALVAFVRDRVVAVLRLDPSRPPSREQRLMELGIDSLMAVELRNLLVTGLGGGIKLPATLIFDYPTVEAIAEFLLRKVFALDADADASAPRAARTSADPTTLADVEHLDDDEVEALLNKRLESL